MNILDSCQLGLKAWANVIYGYSAATFTGRMPCTELADSIVSIGRLTLEKAIKMANEIKFCQAKVIYGDTDSLFIEIKGVTWKEAYKFGEIIASKINELNPHPMFLKLEKVLHPMFTFAKKRYAGFQYESINDAGSACYKGIETIRRDSCPAVSKIMDKILRILFTSKDMSSIIDYLKRQWIKIVNSNIYINDFIFSKKARLEKYENKVRAPPSVIVCRRMIDKNPGFINK